LASRKEGAGREERSRRSPAPESLTAAECRDSETSEQGWMYE
jgi:hypothetical protein